MRQPEGQEEDSMDRRLVLGVGLLLATGGVTAFAQTTPAPSAAPAAPAPAPAAPTPPVAQPVRVRGAIAGFANNVLSVKGRDGQPVDITLKDPVTVATVTKVKLTAIEPNSFIGTATRTDKDGKMTALEVLVFPEAMRGTGEGFFPWDLEPGSMMTNGTVKGAVKSPKGENSRSATRTRRAGRTRPTRFTCRPPRRL
jgi:hypothetical protein